MVETQDAADQALCQLLRELRRIHAHSARLAHAVLAGHHRSVFRGAGVEFEEVREYAEGDDPRSVDWNVTARMGRPFVKRHVDERQRNLAFLFDLSPRMEVGSGAWTPREMAARVCACLMLGAIEHDDRVALIAFGRAVERFERPHQGRAQMMRILRAMLTLPACRGESQPSSALRLATRRLPAHSTLFLVSDFLGDGWEEALQACARQHEVVALCLQDPSLRQLPSGLWRLASVNGEGHCVRDGSAPRVQAAYRDALHAWKAEGQRLFRRCRVTALDLPIPLAPDLEAVVRPVLRYFSASAPRRAMP